jgi:hypothetical protein
MEYEWTQEVFTGLIAEEIQRQKEDIRERAAKAVEFLCDGTHDATCVSGVCPFAEAVRGTPTDK